MRQIPSGAHAAIFLSLRSVCDDVANRARPFAQLFNPVIWSAMVLDRGTLPRGAFCHKKAAPGKPGTAHQPIHSARRLRICCNRRFALAPGESAADVLPGSQGEGLGRTEGRWSRQKR